VDWLGETRVMRLGTLSLGLGILLIPLPGSVPMLALVMSFVPVGTACLFPSVSALVTHRAHREELGQTLGVQQAFGGMARVIGPIWATAAFQGLGVRVPFFVAAVVVGIVALIAFRVRVQLSPSPEPAEAV